jgi:hypothetical protein
MSPIPSLEDGTSFRNIVSCSVLLEYWTMGKFEKFSICNTYLTCTESSFLFIVYAPFDDRETHFTCIRRNTRELELPVYV